MTSVQAVVAELEKFTPAICEQSDPAGPNLVAAF